MIFKNRPIYINFKPFALLARVYDVIWINPA